MSSPRRRLLIDCDPGVDDAIALLLCLNEAQRAGDEILGITLTHGNVPLSHCIKNTLITLDTLPTKNEFFDSRSLPIYPGCTLPLIKNEKEYFPWHGHDGLGDCGLTASAAQHESQEHQIQKKHAALALLRLSSLYPEEITLICLGPLSNIALCCRLDEDFPTRIKEMIWMGGCTTARGNVSEVAEFNVHKDPEAAHIVLSSFPKSTMVGWELTEENPVTWEVFEEFLEKAEASCSKLGEFLRGISQVFLRDREKREGMIICDFIAMAIALRPAIVRHAFMKFVTVELGGKYTRGQIVIDWNDREERPPNVMIVDKIDLDQVHEMLLSIIPRSNKLGR